LDNPFVGLASFPRPVQAVFCHQSIPFEIFAILYPR
jgi:hypothetical protein